MSAKMDNWLPSLITPTPTEGYHLAIKLARAAVRKTHPDDQVRSRLRSDYEEDADALIRVSQLVATNSATITAANNDWN